jgi:glycosyltransferase involved in cell wall biosynthesis
VNKKPRQSTRLFLLLLLTNCELNRRIVRILYLHQHFCPPNGSGNNRSLELALHWVKAGHEVTIVCGSGNFQNSLPFLQAIKRYDFDGVKVIRLNVNYSHFDGFFLRIIHFIQFFFLSIFTSFITRKNDIVYASSTPLTIGLLGIWYKRVVGIHFVFETVDLWPDVPIKMRIIVNKLIIKVLYKIEKWIYNESAHIICLSEGMRDLIIKKGIPKDKVSVSHNGTNCDVFKPNITKSISKITLGYKEDDFIVLYAGTIGLANKLEQLIDIALAVSNPKIHFLIIGNGNRKNEVQDYAIRKKASNIRFIDSVPKKEVKRYFDASDIGAVIFAPFTLLETNSANKWYDYLASGLPVIINYEGWQKYYLERYNCGYSSKDSINLTDWIVKTKENQETYFEKTFNARNLAKLKFDRKTIALELLKRFQKITKIN